MVRKWTRPPASRVAMWLVSWGYGYGLGLRVRVSKVMVRVRDKG